MITYFLSNNFLNILNDQKVHIVEELILTVILMQHMCGQFTSKLMAHRLANGHLKKCYLK